MITPKLTAVLVAMTALVGSGPIAAFAQDAEVEFEQEIGDLTQLAATGGNEQTAIANTEQTADNDVIIANSAESGDARGGDADADADADAEAGDAKGKKSSTDADADATAVAVGGDADSGDATATQTLEDVEIDNSVEQDATTVAANDLEDNDDVTQVQVPVQAQVENIAVALGLDLELDDILL